MKPHAEIVHRARGKNPAGLSLPVLRIGINFLQATIATLTSYVLMAAKSRRCSNWDWARFLAGEWAAFIFVIFNGPLRQGSRPPGVSGWAEPFRRFLKGWLLRRSSMAEPLRYLVSDGSFLLALADTVRRHLYADEFRGKKLCLLPTPLCCLKRN